MHPRQTRETVRPVLPSLVYCMRSNYPISRSPWSCLYVLPISRRRSDRSDLDVNRLDLSEQIERVTAALAAEAGLLVTAKWHGSIDHAVAVDPHRPRLERLCDFVGPAGIVGPDRGRESIGGVVALEDCVVLVFERNRSGDGTEDLLACDFHGVLDVGENRRFDVIAFPLPGFAADRHARAFAFADLEVALHAIELFAGNHRTELGFGIERIAQRHTLARLGQLVDESVVDIALNEDPSAGGTDLAGVVEDAIHRVADRVLHIHVGEDDVRRF